MKEATARIKINNLLEAADWCFFDAGNLRANVRLEPSIAITQTELDALGQDFERTKKGLSISCRKGAGETARRLNA
jgi:type I restriction enzyme R subunit